ncbi:MAG: O-antigen ligase family protein, partial [Thermoleophilia bacterium]
MSLTTLPASTEGRATPLAGLAGAAAAAVLLGMVLAADPPPATIVATGIAGVLVMLTLAVTSDDAAVALGFVLFGVVRVEPAPSDALLAVLAALAVVTGRVHVRRIPVPIVGLLAVLVVLNILSMAGAAEMDEALRYGAITLYLIVLAVWLTSYLRNAARTQLVVRAYVAGAVISSLAAVLALFVAFPGHEVLAGEVQARAQGLFKDPNVFGPFLIPAALIALEEALHPRVLGLRRPAAVAVLVVLVLGIVFAFSRAGWLNFALGVAVMLLVLSLRTQAARATWGAVAMIGVVALFAGGAVLLTGSEQFLQERAQVQSYDSSRFTAQRSGIQLASEHPLGVGP